MCFSISAIREFARSRLPQAPLKELAQNGRGSKSAPQRAAGFFRCLGARIRVLCALKEPAQNGRGVKRAPQRAAGFFRCLGARIRVLCAKQNPILALGVLYGIVAAAGFWTPYDYETQHRLLALAPPCGIHFIDEHGHVHLRPFVYGLRPSTTSAAGYEQDRSVTYPLRFLVRGTSYRILGLVRSRIHLFGVTSGGAVFLLGTDALGRDVFSRLLYGGQISLFTALLASGIAVSMGLILGGLAGYYGGRIDEALMRVAEVFLAVPWLYLLLAIRALLPLHLEPGSVFILLMSVSGLVGWGRPARLVRGVVLSGRDREYVLAARGFGASDYYILRKHVLPQAYAVSITQAALYIPQYITAEVTLSFFGLGVSEPVPSWGNMLAQLRTLFVLENCWWMFSPAVALIFVLALFQWFFHIEMKRLRTSAL